MGESVGRVRLGQTTDLGREREVLGSRVHELCGKVSCKSDHQAYLRGLNNEWVRSRKVLYRLKSKEVKGVDDVIIECIREGSSMYVLGRIRETEEVSGSRFGGK